MGGPVVASIPPHSAFATAACASRTSYPTPRSSEQVMLSSHVFRLFFDIIELRGDGRARGWMWLRVVGGDHALWQRMANESKVSSAKPSLHSFRGSTNCSRLPRGMLGPQSRPTTAKQPAIATQSIA